MSIFIREPTYRFLSMVGAVLLSPSGCGAEALAPFPGGDNRTVVIKDGTTTVFDNPPGSDCLTLPGGECVRPQQQCGAGAHAEVVLDSTGKVQAVVCFPDKPGPYSVIDQQPTGMVDNKGVLVLDGVADGPDILGDLNVTGNNATVYGQGPATSVIGGNANITFNNAIVRGISVMGNTTIAGNDTMMYYCVVYGSVTIASNNNTLSGCDIYGDVTVSGNNNKLLGLRIQGMLVNKGNGNVCTSDVRFTDTNMNRLIEPIELGAAVTCK